MSIKKNKEKFLKVYCQNENGMVWMTADEAIDLTSVRELKNKQESNYQDLQAKIDKLEKTKRNIKTCDY